MSKELSEETKYEFNVYARQLSKDLSNLMDCLRKQDEDNKAILYVGRHIKKKIILPYEEYQKMCQRLEAIENASSSEALKCLEDMAKYRIEYSDYSMPIKDISEYKKIKQALLKSQEQEKVLEIIKKKHVNVSKFIDMFIFEKGNELRKYNEGLYLYDRITEEEFNLLKRYLGNDVGTN